MATLDNEPPCVDIKIDVEQVTAPAPTPTPAVDDPVIVDVLPQDVDPSADAIADLLNQYLNLNRQQNTNNRWSMLANFFTGAALVIVLAVVITFASLHFGGRGGKENNLGCFIRISVSKDGRSNFTTVSDAIGASPDNSPFKMCIFIGAGEYHESVTVGHQKKNLALIGRGIDKTIISSNTTSDRFLGPDFWSAATLSTFGDNFLAQDLTIKSTAPYGVAVESTTVSSNFFKCKFEGNNATVHIKGEVQFYRDCQFYGKNYLVYGYGRAYFQKCHFFSDKSYADEKIVLLSQSSHIVNDRAGFVFHLCDFHLVGRFANYSRTTFLGGASGNFALIAIIQSYLDPSDTIYSIN